MKNKIIMLVFSALILAGCATSSRYDNYTSQQFPPKDKYFTINVYPDSQTLAATNPYYVIGRVSVEGFASSGVSPEGLTHQAKEIARKRGADAIINARTDVFHTYGDELLRFKGELVVFTSSVAK